MGYKPQQYYPYSHKVPQVRTLGQLINQGGTIFDGVDLRELLNYKDENNTKNIQRLTQEWGSDEQDLQSDVTSFLINPNSVTEARLRQFPIFQGTVLIVPVNLIDRSLLFLASDNVIDEQDFKAFMSRHLFGLMQEPKYEVVLQQNNQIESLRDLNVHYSVWVWSRSNTVATGSNKIINITPFVSSVDINSGDNGSSFSVRMSGVNTEYVYGEGWQVGGTTVSTKKGQSVFSSNFYSDNVEKIREEDYFNTILQENDVVFLRLSKLEIEKDRDDNQFEINEGELPNKIFDLIGLVDNVIVNADPNSGNRSTTVSGRDLSKLLIEDGVYFYPYDYTGNSIFANESRGQYLKRFDGQLKSRFQYSFKTVETSLQFIINALSTIEITPTDLFRPYKSSIDYYDKPDANGDRKPKDRRSKIFNITQEAQAERLKRIEKEEEEIEKAKKIVEQAAKEQGLPSSKDDVRTTYLRIRRFLVSVEDFVVEQNGQLAGWGGSTVTPENIVPLSLSGRIFKQESGWTDENGNRVSDAERRAIVNEYTQLSISTYTQQTQLDFANPEIPRFDYAKDSDYAVEAAKAMEIIPRSELVSPSDNLEPINILRQNSSETVVNIAIEQENAEIEKVQELVDRVKELENELLFIQITLFPKKFSKLTPTAQKAFKEIWKVIKLQNSNREKKPDSEREPMRGIWQIFKLIVDKSVRNRRIADSSIGNEHGSIINAIRKVVQEPFAQLLLDTYGDQYYMTVRKPPFDKKTILGHLRGESDVDNEVFPLSTQNSREIDNSESYNSPAISGGNPDNDQTIPPRAVIDIESVNVINDDLVYGHPGQAYSWYRIIPQGILGATGDSIAFAYIRAVFFPQYADIWGSKPMDVVTNYIPYNPSTDSNDKTKTAYFLRQSVLDLKFLIDTNCYLPFTRQGSITIAQDRRIKRGMWIRFKSTAEIFYVDAVSHSSTFAGANVNATTSLTVSRGMVEKYVDNFGENSDSSVLSYFNIIDTEVDQNRFNQTDLGYDTSSKLIENWQVNQEVFDFFLSKQQFR